MIRFYTLILAVLLAAAASAQPAAVDSLYSAARHAYDDGEFEQAELAALRGLREAAELDDLARMRFHVILGFVYVARDQREPALQEFTQVIAVNPAFELDPVQTSPKILHVFKEAKSDYMLRVASEPAIFRMPQADVRLSASWRSLLLPGWGQFYKQQGNKGAAFMAAQAVALAGLIYAQTEVNRRHNDYLHIRDYDNPAIDDRYGEYRRAYQFRNVVGYVTLGIYLGNYLDALYTPVFHRK